jgi:anti-sigma B factor antagonist
VTSNDGDADRGGERRATTGGIAITTRTVAGRTIVTVSGELDLYTAPELRDAVLAAAEDRTGTVIIDLEAVPFMDSSGLGVIVGCLKHLREAGGDLALVSPPGSPPTKLLSLTGLDRAIPTYPSLDAATS